RSLRGGPPPRATARPGRRRARPRGTDRALAPRESSESPLRAGARTRRRDRSIRSSHMKERPTRSKGHGSQLDLVPDRGYAPCLKGLDGSLLLADHGGDLLDGESPEDPEQQHVALIGSKAVKDGPDSIFRKGTHRLGLRVSVRTNLDEDLDRKRLGPATDELAMLVHDPVPSEREQPRPEPALVSLERSDPADRPKERLTDDVLRIGGTTRARVPKEVRRRIRVQGAPGPLRTYSRGLQHPGERLSERHLP